MKTKTIILTLMLLMVAGFNTWAANPDGDDRKVCKIGDQLYDSFDSALSNVKSGQIIYLLHDIDASDLSFTGCNNKNVIIAGTTGSEVLNMGTGAKGGLTGCTITFLNLKMKIIDHTDLTGTWYTQGLYHANKIRYDRVTFEGCIATQDDVEFLNCTFTSNPQSMEYTLWNYGGTVILNKCRFEAESAGTKSFVKQYAEPAGNNATNLAVIETTFIEPTTLPSGWKGCDIYESTNNSATNKIYIDEKSTTTRSIIGYSDENCKNKTQSCSTLAEFGIEDYWPNYAASTFSSLDESSKTLTISTPEELALFAKNVNSGTSYAGYTITINGNLDMNAHYWIPINARNSQLSGSIIQGTNTVNAVISNLKIEKAVYKGNYDYYAGFIAQTVGGLTVKDITFSGAVSIDNGSGVATVLGLTYGNVLFENVKVCNSTITAETKAGALVGFTGGDGITVTVKDCTLENVTVKAEYSYALMVGLVNTKDQVVFEGNNSATNSKAELDETVASTDLPTRKTIKGYTYGVDGTKLWVIGVQDAWAECRTNPSPKMTIDDVEYTIMGDIFYHADGSVVDVCSVAKIGNMEYRTLADAIAAVPENGTETTISVLADIALTDKLLIDGGKKIILDLGGKTLTGRVNVSGAELTVKNGTIKAGTFNQALNVYGSKDPQYKDGIFTYVKVEKDVTLDGATCALGIMSVLGETYFPLSYGVKVDFYGKATNMPAQVSGNIGYDNYKANIGNVDISTNLPEGIKAPSKAMSLYGPMINIYGEMTSTVAAGECQAFILSGMARVNVYDGASIEGSEGFAMKSGNLHVYGGTIKSNGQKINPVQAVSSGSEASGAAISITSFYTSDLFDDRAKISVVVENGNIIGGNNSALLVTHSYKDNSAVALKQGVNLAISGGKFSCGSGVPVLFIDNAANGDTFAMPSAFVSSGLFNIAPDASYLATGKTIIDNPDEVTKGTYPYAVVPLANAVQVAPEVEIASVEKEAPLTPEQQTIAETTVTEAIEDMAENTAATTLPTDTQKNNNEAVNVTLTTTQSVGINIEFTGTKVSVGTETETTVTLKELTFDVTPYVVEIVTINETETSVAVKEIENDQITAPMTFRLPIPSGVTETYAQVYHKHDGKTTDLGLKQIQSIDSKKYIEISTNSFSEFDVKLTSEIVNVPATLYYYAGSSVRVDGTPENFEAAKNTCANAIAFVDKEYANWAKTQKNVVVVEKGTYSNIYYCPDFVLTDKEDFYTPVDFHVVSGSYTRTNTGGLNSVCLPFELSSMDVNNGTIGVFHSTDMYVEGGLKSSGKVYFNEVSNIASGTPCIIKCSATDAGWNIDLAGKTVAAEPNNANALKGSYKKQTIGAGLYKVNDTGTAFGKTITDDADVTAFRVYLNLGYSRDIDASVKEFNIGWADDATGIDNVKVASDSKVIYDLTGRMVNNPVKGGLYIINGKKVILK